MLRIAVPNKGSLSEPATTMLAEAGYRTRRTGRELVLRDEAAFVAAAAAGRHAAGAVSAAGC